MVSKADARIRREHALSDRIPASVIVQAKALGLPLERCVIGGRSIAAQAIDDKQHPYGRYKSKTEMLYADELLLQEGEGLVTWWDYEPWTMVIVESNGKKCRYTPDFVVLLNDGKLRCVEIKGFVREAARIRFLAAQERYPFLDFVMLGRDNGQWKKLL